MKKITENIIKKWFKDNNIEPRHEIKGIKYAVNKANKKYEVDALDLFLLLVTNTPISELYTHSYGFHTSNGRHIINKMSEYYYHYTKKNQS